MFTNRCEVGREEGLLETREHCQGDQQDLTRVLHVAEGGGAQPEPRGPVGLLGGLLIRCILPAQSSVRSFIFELRVNNLAIFF